MTGGLTIIGMWKRLLMKSEVKLQKFSITQKFHVDPSPLAFCAPSDYNLEQFGWLNKSSGTN